MSELVAALVGAAAALVFTAVRDAVVAYRRRRNLASAIVLEFRIVERKLRADLVAAEHHAVVFDPPFSESLFLTVLAELPHLGYRAFVGVRMAYAQLRQINFLKSELKSRFAARQTELPDPLHDAYEAALRQGLARLEEGVQALRGFSHAKTHRFQLPEVGNLTAAERQFWNQ